MARLEATMVTVLAVLMAVFLQQAFAIKCWNCNEDNPNCMDTFDGAKLSGQANQVECTQRTFVENGGSPVCLKAKSSTSGKVRRECSNSESEAIIGCKLVGGIVGFDQCEVCNSDLCNGAAQYGPAVLLITIPLVVLKMLSL